MFGFLSRPVKDSDYPQEGTDDLKDGKDGIIHSNQGPEELVRMETRIIDILRCLVIAMLLVVATATSLAAFKLSRKWEIDSFRNDFEGVATRMNQIFLDQTSAKLWFGKWPNSA